jgi:hypothetical protein
MIRKAVPYVAVGLAALMLAFGIFRKEFRSIYVNARAICYSCIGLE